MLNVKLTNTRLFFTSAIERVSRLLVAQPRWAETILCIKYPTHKDTTNNDKTFHFPVPDSYPLGWCILQNVSYTEISWCFSIHQLHHRCCTHFFDWAFRFWRNAFYRLIFYTTLAGYRINLSRQCSLHACPPCQTFYMAEVFSFLVNSCIPAPYF